jgi:hypothetical protein
MGWTLVLPFNWLIEGTRAEFVLGCVWTASLLIPFGYWAGRVAPDSRAAEIAWRWIFVLPPVAVGFLLVPHAFGLSVASFGEWLCGLAGLLVGSGLAMRVTDTNQSDQPRLSIAARS